MIWNNEKEKLERLINVEKKSYEEVGRFYGVCGATIKKQAKKLGIILEPRREKNPKETFNKGVTLKNKNEKIERCCNIEFVSKNINGNYKKIGEIGERIAIGELAKFEIDVMIPMSDNLPFDLIVYKNDKFYKCQVKTSNSLTESEAISFSITSNNWYSKTKHYYTNNEVDVYICCDLNNIYLFRYDEIEAKSMITLRYKSPRSNQDKKIKYASEYIISENRIKEVFD